MSVELAELSKSARERLEARLLEFEQSWSPGRLSDFVRDLGGEVGPFRSAALIELIKVDLEHQWRQGQRFTVEKYIAQFPELGDVNSVPAELIQAEFEVRQQFGDVIGGDELARRFPDRAEELRRLFDVAGESDFERWSGKAILDTVFPGSEAESVREIELTFDGIPEEFGRYRILRPLGQGAMGDVYLAHDTQLDRQVALKVPNFNEKDDPDFIARFYREAKAAAKLRHPNVCPVYDVGEIEGVHYSTMAFIEGRPLAEFIGLGKPMPVRRAVAIVQKLALALRHAHTVGVIHRDLKPKNVMIDAQAEPIVMDFGLARRIDVPADSRVTQFGTVMGTPAYMSPEQVAGETNSVGPPSDVYSLGVILYELLTGQLPYQGTVTSVIGQILNKDQQPPRPSKMRPEIDRRLDAICLKAMAKHVDERYGSMAEFAAALAESLTQKTTAPTLKPASSSAGGVRLRRRVTCPHCWHEFPPEEVLWISAHPDLRGDNMLGEDAQQRFLPTRFTVDCRAIDVKGVTCQHLACPRCHLVVSRALLEMEPLFLSILGAPFSGKSYFLTSMTWQLRKTLANDFGLSFGDADPVSNQILSDYEEALFLNSQDDELVALRKTEKEGDLYESVRLGERTVWYPRPFVFSVQPLEGHAAYAHASRLSRALCLYDNAGEHFLPGGESVSSPATQHLALSRVLLFLFDPTQHPRFREACRGQSADPQLEQRQWIHRQDQVLLEAANRIRAYSGLAQNAKDSRPLVVVVTKYDAWWSLAKRQPLCEEWVVRSSGGSESALDVESLRSISQQLRGILMQHAPELVTAAEGFSEDVTYIPVSALGRGPEADPNTGGLGIRPRDIEPMWAEVPLLFALHRAVPGLIPAHTKDAGENVRVVKPASAQLRRTQPLSNAPDGGGMHIRMEADS